MLALVSQVLGGCGSSSSFNVSPAVVTLEAAMTMDVREIV
jgi:hypothetical protein